MVGYDRGWGRGKEGGEGREVVEKGVWGGVGKGIEEGVGMGLGCEEVGKS